MKKIFTRWLTALLACVLICPLFLQQAEAAEATLSGATSLRAGNSVTVTLTLSGSGLLGIDANLSYDSDALELLGTKQLIGSGWDMQQSGNKLLLYDTQQTNSINGSEKVLSVTFRVKSGVNIGRSVSASISGTTSDGSAESAFSASWSAAIQAPLSSDAKLKDLRCSNATLVFTGATEYHITVPYDVSSLALDWSCSHSAAEVAVSGNKLSVGANTVTVTVTAENGNIKRYYIYVKRQQDPSYTPNTDALLKSLQVSAGTLSPAFTPEITEYVVYLPNETTHLELTGIARDSKAQGVQQVGSSDLPEGTTTLLMRCTAEDGTTTQDYQIHVVRMPVFTGTLPEILTPEELAEPAPLPPAEVEPEGEPTPELHLPLWITLPLLGEVALWWVAGGALALLLLLLWLLAWTCGRRSGRKKALRQLQAQVITPTPQEEPPLTTEPPAEETPQEAAENASTASAEEAPSEKEAPVEEASPAQEELPAQEEAPAGEDILFVEERPFTREEPAQAQEDSRRQRPSEPLEDLGGMSLDDLLEDIRNM